MGKEKQMGPGLGIALLASAVFACLYFTSRAVDANDAYYYSFAERMDVAIAEAYGIPYTH
jgi:hypothetical protein